MLKQLAHYLLERLITGVAFAFAVSYSLFPWVGLGYGAYRMATDEPYMPPCVTLDFSARRGDKGAMNAWDWSEQLRIAYMVDLRPWPRAQEAFLANVFFFQHTRTCEPGEFPPPYKYHNRFRIILPPLNIESAQFPPPQPYVVK